MLPSLKKNEELSDYWNRINKNNELKLYCQSCCFRYPDNCMRIDLLHPYDSLAENCPDYVPKDMYKGIDRAKCWKKRLEIDPAYKPLPYDDANSVEYYKSLTRDKAKRYSIKMKKKEEQEEK